jgi:hypothetical protein
MAKRSETSCARLVDGLAELEQALPSTLLERCVIVGAAATRLALCPYALLQPRSAPRFTLALAHDDWAATAVSIAECLFAEGWQRGRAPLPDGISTCPRSGHWPLECVHPRHWRVTLVLADGLTRPAEATRLYRLRSDDILLPAHAAGDIATHAPVRPGSGQVRVADPRHQVLADLLACTSPLARERVELRHARAAHAVAVAALLPAAALASLRQRWPAALKAAGYPAAEALQLVSSSLVDTLERTDALHRGATTLLGEMSPTRPAFEAAQRALLAMMVTPEIDLD